MTPADLRALAVRVETEEPSDALNEAVARAFNWWTYEGNWFAPRSRCRSPLSAFLTDLTAAAGLMPEGWVVFYLEQDEATWRACFTAAWKRPVCAFAPTEPRARVAAALRARAAGMEAP